jgi:hypothetical protein
MKRRIGGGDAQSNDTRYRSHFAMKVSVAPEDHLMTKAFRASNPDGTALETRSGLNGCPEGRRRLQGGYRTAIGRVSTIVGAREENTGDKGRRKK